MATSRTRANCRNQFAICVVVGGLLKRAEICIRLAAGHPVAVFGHFEQRSPDGAGSGDGLPPEVGRRIFSIVRSRPKPRLHYHPRREAGRKSLNAAPERFNENI